MKKNYYKPETKISWSQLSLYMEQTSLEVDIDDEEADRKDPGDDGYEDGDALVKDMWGNEVGGPQSIW